MDWIVSYFRGMKSKIFQVALSSSQRVPLSEPAGADDDGSGDLTEHLRLQEGGVAKALLLVCFGAGEDLAEAEFWASSCSMSTPRSRKWSMTEGTRPGLVFKTFYNLVDCGFGLQLARGLDELRNALIG